MIKRLLLAALVLSLPEAPLQAHPGGTDGEGCHVCRTHCEEWGVPQDKKHCHGKKDRSQDKKTEAITQEGKIEAPARPAFLPTGKNPMGTTRTQGTIENLN